MDTLVLKPTYENLFNTYNQDAVGRNADIFAFTEILNEFDTSMSIAIDGNWGSGKSFFVQQVKMVMDAHNDHVPAGKLEHRDEIIYLRRKHYEGKTEPELQPQVCVYYDAWENDNDDDPILSLVYTILQEVKADFDCKKLDFTAIASSIIGLATARPWGELAKSLKRDNPMESIENAKELECKIGAFLDSLLSERGNRLVVFVDELDRCKPEYAVRLLERIKHYFKQPLSMGGTDKYMNLVIVHRDIHRLIHATEPSTIAMYMNLFQLDKKALAKLNALRVLAGQPEI